MAYKLSTRSIINRQGVNPKLIAICDEAIRLTPIDFGIPSSGGYRTAEQQYALFCDGKSKADGYDKKSYHQTGNALDFYAFVDGKASWEEGHLAVVAATFLQAAIKMDIKIQWGGLWKGFRDMPHIQLMETGDGSS